MLSHPVFRIIFLPPDALSSFPHQFFERITLSVKKHCFFSPLFSFFFQEKREKEKMIIQKKIQIQISLDLSHRKTGPPMARGIRARDSDTKPK